MLWSQLKQDRVALSCQLRDTPLAGGLRRRCPSRLLPSQPQRKWLHTIDNADCWLTRFDCCLQLLKGGLLSQLGSAV